MHKEINYGSDSREKLLEGVSKVAKAVSLTLGAKGRNVILKQEFGPPLITNDGVTIASEIFLKNDFESLGAEVVKEVANNTNNKAGDGTTTAIVLCHAIFKEGLKYIQSGANAIDVKSGIKIATDLVIKELKKNATKIKTLEEKEQVAFISAQDREVAKIVAKMIDQVGDDGVITLEEGGSDLKTSVVDGMQIDAGWLNPFFVNNIQKQTCEYKDISVLVTDIALDDSTKIFPFVREMAKNGNKSLLIISGFGAHSEVAIDFLGNKKQGTFDSLIVRTPTCGERQTAQLEDIAVFTGAKFYSRELGMKLEDLEMSDLGTVGKVVADRDKTILTAGGAAKESVALHVGKLKTEKKKTKSAYEKENLEERIGGMMNGIGLITVGASTEIEAVHRLHRIEDAVGATKAAISEGVLPGGGVALATAYKSAELMTEFAHLNEDQRIGVGIVLKALDMPAKQIAENSGEDGGAIVAKIKESGLGYNAQTGNYADMKELGIVDPLKVTRHALEYASSAASMLLTTECAITYETKEEEKK